MLYYLYKKTHRDTGLKYLGYAKSSDPAEYRGSGAKTLNITWDKVKYSLLHRTEFEAKLKETQNY